MGSSGSRRAQLSSQPARGHQLLRAAGSIGHPEPPAPIMIYRAPKYDRTPLGEEFAARSREPPGGQALFRATMMMMMMSRACWLRSERLRRRTEPARKLSWISSGGQFILRPPHGSRKLASSSLGRRPSRWLIPMTTWATCCCPRAQLAAPRTSSSAQTILKWPPKLVGRSARREQSLRGVDLEVGVMFL